MERKKLTEVKFEWVEEKDRINRQKHGISFETASYVFRDEYLKKYWYLHCPADRCVHLDRAFGI